MKSLFLTQITLILSSFGLFAQSVSIQPSNNNLNTSELSINSDGSLPKAKLHIKGVGLQPTITPNNIPIYTSITAEAVPNPTPNEVYAVYSYANNSSLSNISLMGEVGNTGIFNIGFYGIAQTQGDNDNFGIKGYADNRGNGAAFGVFGAAYGTATSRAKYGIYGEVQGDAPNKYAGYFDGNVTVVGTITLLSDERLKTNILPVNDALKTVLKLKPASYFYRNNLSNLSLPEGNHYGFLAQEIQQVLPDLVTKILHPAKYDLNTKKKIHDEKELLGVNYTELIPLLVKAIQEQQSQIEALKTEIRNLRNR